MSKYKIVFVDIDDTLNPSNGEVSKHTKEVMTKLKEKGIHVVVNSGRSTKYAIEKSLEANLSNYIISSNGAEVYDYHNDVIIFEQPIPKNTIKEVYKYCEKMGITLILNSIKNRFINIKDYNYNTEPATYFEDIDEVLDHNNINQLIVLSKNFDRMLVIPNMFKEEFPNLKVVHSSVGLIEDHRVKGKEYYHDLVLENTAKSKVRPLLLWACSIAAVFAIFFGIYKDQRYRMLDAAVSPYYTEYDMSDISRGDVDSATIAHLYDLFIQIADNMSLVIIHKRHRLWINFCVLYFFHIYVNLV